MEIMDVSGKNYTFCINDLYGDIIPEKSSVKVRTLVSTHLDFINRIYRDMKCYNNYPYICVCIVYIFMCACVHLCVCIHVCVCMCMCMYVCMCVG